MVVLGKPVSSADDVKVAARRRELVGGRLKPLGDRIVRLAGMQRVLYRAFGGLVMLRKWTVIQWCEQPSDAFRIHDERAHVFLGCRIGFEIRHIVTAPALLRLIPPDLPTVSVPRFAGGIAGSPIVEYAPVGRPRPSPIRIEGDPRGILR